MKRVALAAAFALLGCSMSASQTPPESLETVLLELLALEDPIGRDGIITTYTLSDVERVYGSAGDLVARERAILEGEVPDTDACTYNNRADERALELLIGMLRAGDEGGEAHALEELRATGAIATVVARFWNGGGNGSYVACGVYTVRIILGPTVAPNTLTIVVDSTGRGIAP